MQRPKKGKFRFYGGHPALDFVNTSEFRLGANREEMLCHFEDVCLWGLGAGVLTEQAVERLVHIVGHNDENRTKMLAGAIELRDLMARLFDAVVDDRTPDEKDVDEINALAANFFKASNVAWSNNGYNWSQNGQSSFQTEFVFPLTKSALDLLTSDDCTRISRCHDDRGCGWLFVDRSRASKRLWCSMRECGNRAKARSFAERSRDEERA